MANDAQHGLMIAFVICSLHPHSPFHPAFPSLTLTRLLFFSISLFSLCRCHYPFPYRLHLLHANLCSLRFYTFLLSMPRFFFLSLSHYTLSILLLLLLYICESRVLIRPIGQLINVMNVFA